MIEILTIVALVFGIAGVILDIVILTRQHETDERLSRDELHEALSGHHDVLLDSIVERLIEPPTYVSAEGEVKIDATPGQVEYGWSDGDDIGGMVPREPGTIRQDQIPSWWNDR